MSYLFPSSTITFDAALRDLASGSPKARAIAAHALGGVTEPVERRRAVDALVRALDDDDRPEVRAEAASSLGELGEPGALPSLIKRLADGAAPVRQNAAIALGTMRAIEGFEPLAEALAQGPADLRFQAATSLAEIDPVKSFPHVVKALSDRDPQVVGAAALSVGAIASEAGDPVMHEAARTALAAQLDHSDAGARFDVAYALADLDDASGTKVLAGSIADEGRAWDAVMALAQIKALPELVQAVVSKKTPSEAATLAAGRVLAIEPEHAGARKLLIESLTSRKVHVRGIAIDQMSEVGGAWAKVALDKLARSIKGSELLEPIANALRAISAREKS
ncbi:MAG TPA: HEAT repeat domain-containing protein [Kofleriaceae bacterium]